jgi:hypothetical protein
MFYGHETLKYVYATEDSPPSETVVFKGLTPTQIFKVLRGSQRVLM